MDNQKPKSRSQRNQEPLTIDTTPTGTHAAGNYLRSEGAMEGKLPPIQSAAEIWADQEDQAKQGMARKFDMKNAQAAPDHPHVGHQRGSGEIQ